MLYKKEVKSSKYAVNIIVVAEHTVHLVNDPKYQLTLHQFGTVDK